MQIALKPEHWEKMLVHVQAHAPLEACGLLAGRKSFVEDVLLIENEARSPNRFRMDPKQQLKAFHWMQSNGLELIGIFHSHPAGLETPSERDIAEAAYPVIQVIWSQTVGRWSARAFWIGNEQAREVTLQLVDK